MLALKICFLDFKSTNKKTDKYNANDILQESRTYIFINCLDLQKMYPKYTLRRIQMRENCRNTVKQLLAYRVSGEEKVSCSLSETVTNAFKEVKSGCLFLNIQWLV